MSVTLLHISRTSLYQFINLTKPRVNLLIVFCALIGMLMALAGSQNYNFSLLVRLTIGLVGIGIVSSAAAAVNCLLERKIDAKMARTAWRPLPSGNLTVFQTMLFSIMLASFGFWLLIEFVSPLTAYLTLLTFFGYAFIYTIILKPLTPQNIVIGGASGAMPPVLGWSIVSGTIAPEAWLLFLIIFVWTPPHFWALALYRVDDYRRSGLPMLPVTHGSKFTRLQILLYAILLLVTSIMPFVVGMSGTLYITSAVLLGSIFVKFSWNLYLEYSEKRARQLFRFSINYLALLFFALLVDKFLEVYFF
ncbi:MAG: protoheme IX farnesyltransferase [Betaproteobacteria bacterium TMED82]|nr:MAG: protoheme IX farnesyltransferase [Betaproteobacteria bacterium TMED82]|tara:strand:- start:12335 stop:13249 length:915 start_codon:yes stop_codon:yes gene_type:complete